MSGSNAEFYDRPIDFDEMTPRERSLVKRFIETPPIVADTTSSNARTVAP